MIHLLDLQQPLRLVQATSAWTARTVDLDELGFGRQRRPSCD